MMKKLIMMLGAALLSLAAYAGDFTAMRDPSAFRRMLSEKTEAESSIDCRFSQTKYLSVFSEKVVSKGRFCFDRGDVALLYDSGYQIIIAGTKLKTLADGKTSVVNLGGNPVMGQMKSLLSAAMTGDLDRLGASYRLDYQESSKEYLVKLKPSSPSLQSYIVSMDIYFDKADCSVNRLVIHENSSDYTSYDFSSKKFNTKIDEKIFSIH